MRKHLASVIAVLVVFSLSTSAIAVEVPPDSPPQINELLNNRSSAYLDGYSVAIEARGDGEIAVIMNVDGKGVMDKIGVREVEIDYKENGTWKYYDSVYAAEHPEFYDYDSRDFMGTTYFQGTPGVLYRVTLTVYAGNSTGHDTGYITSYAVTCK